MTEHRSDAAGFSASHIAAIYGNGSIWYQLEKNTTSLNLNHSEIELTFTATYKNGPSAPLIQTEETILDFMEYGVTLEKKLGVGK